MSDNGNTEWHLVAKTSEVTDDEPKAVRVGDHLIALFNVDGNFYATHVPHPHRQGHVAAGDRGYPHLFRQSRGRRHLRRGRDELSAGRRHASVGKPPV